MTEESKSSSHDFRKMFVIGSFCKACRTLVSKRKQEKRHHSSGKSRSQPKRKSDDGNNNKSSTDTNRGEERVMNTVADETISHTGLFRHRSVDNHFTSHLSPSSSPTPLSRNPSLSRSTSRKSPVSRLLKSISRKNVSDLNIDTGSLKMDQETTVKEGDLLSKNSIRKDNASSPKGGGLLSRNYSKKGSGPLEGSLLSRSLSRKGSSMNLPAGGSSLSRSSSGGWKGPTPIMYSNSNGLVKPPPMEKRLECTLEELCLGAVKRVMITRDVVTNDGRIVKEEEKLTIKVKPGWTKGTQITFEGMGNERPGSQAADIIFVITEKTHPLFRRREGDDLELAVKIPLVKALTGCNLSIQLLGGEKMSLYVDDIIQPGYEKIIPGQGMPKPKVQGNRGNLIIKFLVEFPEQLTEEQKADVVSILRGSS